MAMDIETEHFLVLTSIPSHKSVMCVWKKIEFDLTGK
jgi:hypothetical protein